MTDSLIQKLWAFLQAAENAPNGTEFKLTAQQVKRECADIVAMEPTTQTNGGCESLVEKLESAKITRSGANRKYYNFAIERAIEIVRQHEAEYGNGEWCGTRESEEFINAIAESSIDKPVMGEGASNSAVEVVGRTHDVTGSNPVLRDIPSPTTGNKDDLRSVGLTDAKRQEEPETAAKEQRVEIPITAPLGDASVKQFINKMRYSHYANLPEKIADVFDSIVPYLRTTEPICPYIVTSRATSEGDGGTSYCSLAAKPVTVSDVEVKNLLHRMNLDRSDIAALPEGSTIAINITTHRQAADLIMRLSARKPRVGQSGEVRKGIMGYRP